MTGEARCETRRDGLRTGGLQHPSQSERSCGDGACERLRKPATA
jgi:hypothetical protein